MNAGRSQSALDPAAGSGALAIDQLGTAMYVGAAIIFVWVMALALYGVFGRAQPIRARRWIVGGGLLLPSTVLTALLVYSLAIGNALTSLQPAGALQFLLDCLRGIGDSTPLAAQPMRVHVVGKQWWWEVRYETPELRSPVVLANELHIPVGRTVELKLASSDVIHSFWAPSLAGKVDMIPGRTTRLLLRSDEVGVFRGQCAEYCGGQHALMAFHVVVESEPQFQSWLSLQSRPASEPENAFLKQGRDAFFKGGCQECHAVRGTAASSTLGPDLTHVGSRRSLAAGVLSNHIGTLAGWIAGAQDIKPGNAMPSSAAYTGEELRALAAWLQSLQ